MPVKKQRRKTVFIPPSERDELALLFHLVQDIKPLSSGEEIALAARIKKGDTQARNELVVANLRFVVDVAKNFQHRGLSMADLVSVGGLGLITAAERFDGTKGFKFISYAVWWIRQAILQALAEQVRAVKVPLNKQILLRKIVRAIGELNAGHPDGAADISPAAIAAHLKETEVEVQETLLATQSPVHLDEIVDPEEQDGQSVYNLFSGQAEETDAAVERGELQGEVREILSVLDDREYRIIRLYFGLDGGGEMTLGQIGATMGITRERVRQLKERALAKLGNPTLSRELRIMTTGAEPKVETDPAFRRKLLNQLKND